jgi:hypothetical protein
MRDEDSFIYTKGEIGWQMPNDEGLIEEIVGCCFY